MHGRVMIAGAVLSAALVLPVGVSAQNGAVPTDPRAAAVPFGPGESMEYQVKLGIFSVGSGSMAVTGIDTIRGRPTYRLEWQIAGGIPLARVDDKFQSWLDTRNLVSRRFIQDIHEVDYEKLRHYEFYPEERRFEMLEGGEGGPMPTSMPLDDISFVYYARTLPLEVGQTYSLNRYFKESGNPVVIRVLRRDRIEVPAGTFNTIVIQPVIQTDGLFGEGGEAEIHFTDDERRILVYMRSKVPVMGSLSLHLRQIQEGVPLNPEARRTSTR